MAYTSNSLGSDTKVQSCSKNYVKTYEQLQKQFDEQRQTLSKANLEIIAYPLGLESVEAQLVVHQKNEAVYEECSLRILSKRQNQLSSKDKTGLGYGDQLNKNDSSGSELFNSIFDSSSSDGDDNQTNDRFKKNNRYHAVPPPLTRNYMPPLADLSFVSDDDEDIFQSNDLQATDKPSFKKIKFTNTRNESVKPKQAEKPRITTQNPKVDRTDWNGKMTQKLRLGFKSTKKACFVCGSYSHLIKDYDFHENRMAKKSVLKNMGKNAVLTRSGKIPVSTAKKSSLRATTSTSTFRPVNTTTYKVNVSKLRTNAFHKSNSPIRRSFYKPTTRNTKISNEKVNTVRVNGVNTAGQTAISAVKGNGVTAVKASVGCVWRPKMTDLNNVSKDNSRSWVSKRGNPQQALKNKRIFDSGCSRLHERNKDFLTDYQDIDGGFVAFGGSARGDQLLQGIILNKMLVTRKLLVNKVDANYKRSDENDTADDSAGESLVQKPASENKQALKNVLDKMMDQERRFSRAIRLLLMMRFWDTYIFTPFADQDMVQRLI
ncbi:hypothetical protein Tco_0371620 [Tanacetum coccineum]